MIENKSEISVKKGISFVFEDEGNKICIWGSTLNGKEIIYLNDEIVSEKQNIKLKNNHYFSNSKGNEFEVKLETISILKGKLKCTVFKNASRIKTFTTKFNQPQYLKLDMKTILVFALLGLIIGLLDIPEKFLIPIIIAITIAIFTVKYITTPAQNKGNYIIEEIDG